MVISHYKGEEFNCAATVWLVSNALKAALTPADWVAANCGQQQISAICAFTHLNSRARPSFCLCCVDRIRATTASNALSISRTTMPTGPGRGALVVRNTSHHGNRGRGHGGNSSSAMCGRQDHEPTRGPNAIINLLRGCDPSQGECHPPRHAARSYHPRKGD